MTEKILIGGQAVLEGVMMRAPNSWAIAVRKPSGEIVVKKDPLLPWSKKHPWMGWPVIRGAASLIQTLVLGVKALDYSANMALEDEPLKAKSDNPSTPVGESEESRGVLPYAPAKNPSEAKAPERPFSRWAMGATVAIALAAGLILFLFLPLLATQLLLRPFEVVEQSNFVFNLTDGIIRMIIFLLYILVISALKDIRRVFQYHGAEHKVVYTYEAGEDLVVENTLKYPTTHPRCGTSFLLVVMVVSMLAFTFISKSWPFWAKLGSRMVLIPLIAGVSYEFIRFSSAKIKTAGWCYLVKPGLMLQRLTTREPDEEQIKVAIVALKDALAVNKTVSQ